MTSTASPRLAAVVRAAAPLVTDVAVRAHVVALLAEFGVDEPTAQRWFDSGVSEADGDRVTRLRAVVDASEPTDVEQAGTGAFYTPPDLAEHIVESAINRSMPGRWFKVTGWNLSGQHFIKHNSQ